MLDSFMLKDKLSRESELVVTDVWNNLFIIVEKNGDTTTYRLDYFRLLGQPFRRVDNNDYSNGKRHINLEVNNAIYNVLPKRSLTRKIAGLNALKEEYIRWLASSNIELIDDIE